VAPEGASLDEVGREGGEMTREIQALLSFHSSVFDNQIFLMTVERKLARRAVV